jgi:uncharacterized protein
MVKPTHDSLIEQWENEYDYKEHSHWEIINGLSKGDYDVTDEELKESFGRHHNEVFESIDCTKCGERCKVLEINFKPDDLHRFAEKFGITVERLIRNKNLIADSDKSSYAHKELGCSMLGKDGKCTVYDVRPDYCKRYPYTKDGDNVGWTMVDLYKRGIWAKCPAAFHIYDRTFNDVIELDDIQWMGDLDPFTDQQ